MTAESARVQSRCAEQAKAHTGLVLDIDDFAIRKVIAITQAYTICEVARF